MGGEKEKGRSKFARRSLCTKFEAQFHACAWHTLGMETWGN